MTDKIETRAELDEALDKYLLKRLKKKDAEPQLFEIARKRLKDLGLTKEPKEGSDAARLADEFNNDPEKLKTHNVPEFIAEVSDESGTDKLDTAVG